MFNARLTRLTDKFCREWLRPGTSRTEVSIGNLMTLGVTSYLNINNRRNFWMNSFEIIEASQKKWTYYLKPARFIY